ncbi:hypothetical protein CDD80_5826 [Ophiocordyceps camponoti-rufipedis]|uniref:Nephrocystin 3-like N-terminal domain-containing protein n=1 Tax=Ophiocordyceps camponoti-rufipedis TaxID=2004952 RepID=A0A2C5ZLK9_9HYPO|nr:hypothetical protein CDD80_5826 [Ophiocordyceps camponoti-rufipedis]
MSGLEGLAAFGFACNVMQVIGFFLDGAHVVKTVYKSGCMDENLTERTLHLIQGLQALEQSLTSSPKSSTKDEQELLEIARGCRNAASSLKAEMDRIAGVGSRGKGLAAMGAGCKSFFGKRKIKKLEKEMQSRQRVFENRLLLRVCSQNEAIKIKNQEGFDGLGFGLRAFVETIAEGHTSLDKLIRNESASIKEHVTTKTSQLKQDLDTTVIAESAQVQGHVSNQFVDKARQEAETQARDRLLESVRYATMNDRWNQIKDSHEDTFEWIFPKQQDEESSEMEIDRNESAAKVAWYDFEEWLRSDDRQPYWISGKAGSGKSTLIKFLVEHPRTRSALDSRYPNTVILSHSLKYELETRLETLPSHLNDLYKAMWERLNDSKAIYKNDAACYFNLLLECMKIGGSIGHSDIVLFTLAGPSLRADVPDKEEWINPEVFNNG